jgi:hypothetical protein
MKRFWQIISLGLLIWGLSLVWPMVNAVFTPRVADAIVVGLVVAFSAYFLGRHFTPPFNERLEGDEVMDSAPVSRPLTRPSASIVFPFSRTPRSTRPIVTPDLHSRATLPLPVVGRQGRPAHITKPMLQVGR